MQSFSIRLIVYMFHVQISREKTRSRKSRLVNETTLKYLWEAIVLVAYLSALLENGQVFQAKSSKNEYQRSPAKT